MYLDELEDLKFAECINLTGVCVYCVRVMTGRFKMTANDQCMAHV
jgi:hypothetical protein